MHVINQQQISMGTLCGEASSAPRLVARQLDHLIRSCVFGQGIILPQANVPLTKQTQIIESYSVFLPPIHPYKTSCIQFISITAFQSVVRRRLKSYSSFKTTDVV